MAAVLACGEGAVLSHRSAAALWDLLPASTSRIDVTRCYGRTARSGINVHRVRQLHRDDRSTRNGIPVTTVARTLLDLSETGGREQLERALDQAERLQLFDLRAVSALIARSNGRQGIGVLRSVIGGYRGPAPSRSELERRFLDLSHSANLPPPSVNCLIAGLEVDIAWIDQRVIVELDGYTYHRTRQAFERDRARDSVLQVAGYRVLRVTHRRLENEPASVVADLRGLLGL
jgi:hypothetical protein